MSNIAQLVDALRQGQAEGWVDQEFARGVFKDAVERLVLREQLVKMRLQAEASNAWPNDPTLEIQTLRDQKRRIQHHLDTANKALESIANGEERASTIALEALLREGYDEQEFRKCSHGS